MKKYRRMLAFLFVTVMLISAACGKPDFYQGDRDEEISQEDVQELSRESMPETGKLLDGSENAIILSEELLYRHYQPMERTWEKDYTSEEWKDEKCKHPAGKKAKSA